MTEKPKHDALYYNKYGDLDGHWLVCAKCGKEEVTSNSNHPNHGWTGNWCPTCYNPRKGGLGRTRPVDFKMKDYL